MNTWAVELVSKLVDESKTWEEFGANVAKELMRQRAAGMHAAALFADQYTHPDIPCTLPILIKDLHAIADRVERGEA